MQIRLGIYTVFIVSVFFVSQLKAAFPPAMNTAEYDALERAYDAKYAEYKKSHPRKKNSKPSALRSCLSSLVSTYRLNKSPLVAPRNTQSFHSSGNLKDDIHMIASTRPDAEFGALYFLRLKPSAYQRYRFLITRADELALYFSEIYLLDPDLLKSHDVTMEDVVDYRDEYFQILEQLQVLPVQTLWKTPTAYDLEHAEYTRQLWMLINRKELGKLHKIIEEEYEILIKQFESKIGYLEGETAETLFAKLKLKVGSPMWIFVKGEGFAFNGHFMGYDSKGRLLHRLESENKATPYELYKLSVPLTLMLNLDNPFKQ